MLARSSTSTCSLLSPIEGAESRSRKYCKHHARPNLNAARSQCSEIFVMDDNASSVEVLVGEGVINERGDFEGYRYRLSTTITHNDYARLFPSPLNLSLDAHGLSSSRPRLEPKVSLVARLNLVLPHQDQFVVASLDEQAEVVGARTSDGCVLSDKTDRFPSFDPHGLKEILKCDHWNYLQQ